MQCSYFDAGACRSCRLMGVPHAQQVSDQERHCRSLVGGPSDLQWLPAVAGAEAGYRNKAKMVVGGTLAEPTLGILDASGRGIDLRACGICSPGLRAALPELARFVTLASLTPYDVPSGRGELKHLLVTEAPDGGLMVRFVLRSQEPVARIRKHLPTLLSALPQVVVASVNLQPVHAAVLEGEREILLTETATLRMAVAGLDLHLPPQSFFQTNTEVATTLYRQVAAWVDEVAPATVWDLYCGVGGFALVCAGAGRTVVGVETSVEAVAGARLSAREAGAEGVRFEAADATAWVLAAEEVPDLVVVNPPRRGIGPELADWLERSGRHVVYSSCNADSLARDLRSMPSLRPRRAQVLDMFPQTPHYEVVVLLERED
ncbi:23S rRNA (uracil(747)-C(5))-methyltransferase RlmC [Aquipuribacter sp. MA13-6]|uniref:23S rRNA (uracil(747)-C(5))-methyltransferase RlmC n=1 Tax=unclassified Aquipuribacter TaxID=2635084 RepID=UPI003EEDA5C0